MGLMPSWVMGKANTPVMRDCAEAKGKGVRYSDEVVIKKETKKK
jgi:ribosomal protein L6P/L9E